MRPARPHSPKGGTGDVLTGLIAGMMAQNPEDTRALLSWLRCIYTVLAGQRAAPGYFRAVCPGDRPSCTTCRRQCVSVRVYRTASEEETIGTRASDSHQLNRPCLVLLTGNLGAGRRR